MIDKEQISDLRILCSASPKYFVEIINTASISLLDSINEIFLNISELTFPISNKKILTDLEDNFDTVENLSHYKATHLKNTLKSNRKLVQNGLYVALDYLDG